MSYLRPGQPALGCAGNPACEGCRGGLGCPPPKSLGLFPPEGITDWVGIGVIGFLAYKFFWDPHSGEHRRRKARAYGRLARMKLRKV